MSYEFNTARRILAFLVSSSILTGCASLAAGQSAADAIAAEKKEDAKQAVEQIRRTPATKNADAAAVDARSEAKAAEALKRRPGEQIRSVPSGRSVILGMHVQELEKGRVHVVEVGAASPAFRAGVQKGDEIISYGGFRSDTYRGWIDGMRKITTQTPDQTTLPLIVRRNDKRVAINVLVPLAALRSPRDIAEEYAAVQKGEAAAPGPPVIVPDSRPVSVEENIAVTQQFNEFFGDVAANPADRAMAQIFRLVAPSTTLPVASSKDQAPAPAGPSADAARIGLAGFRNDQNGMLVMLDVGGLAPGNYLVAIEDPGFNAPVPEPDQPNAAPAPSGVQPIQNNSPPQSNLQRRSSAVIPQTILAQVIDSAPPASEAVPARAPPSDSPLGAPPAAVPSGKSMPPSRIGTFTVDDSGTGRMQELVEGLQVRDVVGQAIVIFSQSQPDQSTLPANLDPTTDPSTQVQPQAAAAEPQTAGSASAAQPNLPVAAGVIQLLPDRRPIDAGRNRDIEPSPPLPPAEPPVPQSAGGPAPSQ